MNDYIYANNQLANTATQNSAAFLIDLKSHKYKVKACHLNALHFTSTSPFSPFFSSGLITNISPYPLESDHGRWSLELSRLKFYFENTVFYRIRTDHKLLYETITITVNVITWPCASLLGVNHYLMELQSISLSFESSVVYSKA